MVQIEHPEQRQYIELKLEDDTNEYGMPIVMINYTKYLSECAKRLLGTYRTITYPIKSKNTISMGIGAPNSSLVSSIIDIYINI